MESFIFVICFKKWMKCRMFRVNICLLFFNKNVFLKYKLKKWMKNNKKFILKEGWIVMVVLDIY